jgi:hypothetical protein
MRTCLETLTVTFVHVSFANATKWDTVNISADYNLYPYFLYTYPLRWHTLTIALTGPSVMPAEGKWDAVMTVVTN